MKEKTMKSSRPEYLGIKLTKEENAALILWANSEGLPKSNLARRVLRLALRDAAKSKIFPTELCAALNIRKASITA